MVRRKIGRRPGAVTGRTGKPVRPHRIVRDMLLSAVEGRCPRDAGLLTVAMGEPGVEQRCCLCGWRRYAAAAIAEALKERERQEAATVRALGNSLMVAQRQDGRVGSPE